MNNLTHSLINSIVSSHKEDNHTEGHYVQLYRHPDIVISSKSRTFLPEVLTVSTDASASDLAKLKAGQPPLLQAASVGKYKLYLLDVR